MKILTQRGEAMFSADVPDDSVRMEKGDRGYLKELSPIVEIDYEHKMYRRDGQNALSFPAKWYQTTADALSGGMTIEWVEVKTDAPVAPVVEPAAPAPPRRVFVSAADSARPAPVEQPMPKVKR